MTFRNRPPKKRTSSVRNRAAYASILLVLNFIGFGLLIGNLNNEALVIPMLLVFAAIGLYTLSLRCPNCGTPIYWRKTTIVRFEYWSWSGPLVPKDCSACGAELP